MTRDEAVPNWKEMPAADLLGWYDRLWASEDNECTSARQIRDEILARLTAPAAGGDVELVARARKAAEDNVSKTALQGYVIALCDTISRLRAVPQGWKLVPVEPTPEMVEACFNAGNDGPYTAWHTMLTAAPAAPAPEKGVG
jgi:hypothetical protein